MKKVFLKIIKEDSSSSDATQKKKDSLSNLIVAGDSIAVGMSISGLKQRGAKSKGFKGNFNNTVPIYPAVRGGMDTEWIKNNLLAHLDALSKQSPSMSNYKLIIIAGTNDAYNSAHNPGSSRWNVDSALDNISQMAQKAKSLGIDFTVMKLAQYEPKGKYASKAMKPSIKKRHQEFIKKFNSGISSYNNFEMIFPTHNDGLHIYGTGPNTQLLNRALASLKIKAANIEIPTTNKAISNTPMSPVSSRDCHINNNCGCVDRSISGEVTIISVQKALNEIGIEVEQTGNCDNSTRKAIMKFQKQQQKNGFEPPDGREFLRCDACVGPNTMAAINQELSSKNKTLQGMLSPEELIKVKKRRVRILKSMSGKGKTLQDVKNDAATIGCHPDLVILASVLHSEPTARGRWSDEGFAVFNVIINRIQANGPGKGPHFWGTDSGSKAWNICLNTSPVLRGQSGANPPFSSKNFPRDLRASVEKVKEFVKKRLSEGSNIGGATFFVHTNAQQYFYNVTQKRIKEFGSLAAAKQAAKSEHSEAGITWKGSIKTPWPSGHPLRRRWRGFGYGKSAQQIRDSWTGTYGAAPQIRVDGSTEEEKNNNRRKLQRSSIEVFGNRQNRNNWSRKALSDGEIEAYLREILKETEKEKDPAYV